MKSPFSLLAALAAGVVATAIATAQTASAEANPFLPLAAEPPAALHVEAPVAGPLARGVAVIPYRTENFRVLPVFGPDAVGVSPRAGHLHVTVDALPWHWADAGDNHAVVVAGLPAGPHKVTIELADPNHVVLTGQTVSFDVPAAAPHSH